MSSPSLKSNTVDESQRSVIVSGDQTIARVVGRIMSVACQGLPRMYLAETAQCAFTRTRYKDGSLQLQGRSARYAAIVLLGATRLNSDQQAFVLAGRTAGQFCSQLIEIAQWSTNVGDVALTAWAAAELSHPQLDEAIHRLLALLGQNTGGFTVGAAWSLSALVAARNRLDVADAAERTRLRLMEAFVPEGGLFRHWTDRRLAPWYRSHVGCFADQVYPIQALARYSAVFNCSESLQVAARCADQICRLQGRHGQWWWHYDCRTGRVVEGYPVYTVHQDSMAPMALLDLQEAGGPDHVDAITRGLKWMQSPPELDCRLVDEENALIWRSIRRNDPAKFVRRFRAVLTRFAPAARASLLDHVFRPTRIDYEDRPYHLGWILFTWGKQA